MAEQRIKVMKAKYDNDGFMHVEYTQTWAGKEGTTLNAKFTADPDWKIDETVKEMFALLAPHAAFYCDQITQQQYDSWYGREEEFHKMREKFKVTGYVIGGDDEEEGVTIIAQRVLRGNRVMNMVVPFIKFEGNPDDPGYYEYGSELYDVVGQCDDQVREYLSGKKWKDPQGNLFEQQAEKDLQQELAR